MDALPWLNPDRTGALLDALSRRILVLDGAMGTMIQAHGLDEAGYRGERFAVGRPDAPTLDQRGNNDLLTLSQPAIITGVHRAYLEAGADLVETNTFNSTALSQADYGTESLVHELNLEAARLARTACEAVTARDPSRPRFVVGVLGPTSRTASISPDVNNPGFRATTFEDLVQTYRPAIEGLIDGGADLLMIETVFDTLNAKAALYATDAIFRARGALVPVAVSGTITDRSGRTLSGQTAEAFWISIAHARPLIVGLNCALGARDLRAHVDVLARIADAHVSCHPNAGLPNAFGGYDETPEMMAEALGAFARDGLLNLVGGCCGTTPGHIAAIAAAVAPYPPRVLPAVEDAA